jgi:UDP-N-acetylmuramate dehydrogenase
VSEKSSNNAPLIEQLPKVQGSYRPNAQLSKTNWFNVGGPAEVLFKPKDAQDLAVFLSQKPKNIPVTILGVGSNLLVRDGGIEGVVIKLGRAFTSIEAKGECIEAGAGALGYHAAMVAAENGIAGLEFLSGIPGTIGGALAMNAGAYQSDTASVLTAAEVVDENGNIEILKTEQINYVYRGHRLPKKVVFTKGFFKGRAGNKEAILEQIHNISQQRNQTQPIKERTSGSTFKNPSGHKAWELIDKAGCRGLTFGGAQVSEKHCNFFINTGNATASDIENLGKIVQEKVKESTGVTLEWEIQIIGKHD